VLGVDPGASHDEIKQAYVALALEHHPDRGRSDPTDRQARQQAEWRIREINAAWTVLRSPGRRAAYDRELRGEPPLGSRSAPRPARTTPVRPGGDDGRGAPGSGGPAPPGFEVPAPAAPWLRFGPAAVIVVILAAIFVFTAYAVQRDTERPPGVRVETNPTFAEGSCVLLGSVGGRVTPVPVGDCATGGAYRVEEVGDLGRPCPRGTEAFQVPEERLQICLAPARP
jgi:hypothetical protein